MVWVSYRESQGVPYVIVKIKTTGLVQLHNSRCRKTFGYGSYAHQVRRPEFFFRLDVFQTICSGINNFVVTDDRNRNPYRIDFLCDLLQAQVRLPRLPARTGKQYQGNQEKKECFFHNVRL
jgi:hypothetical protein